MKKTIVGTALGLGALMSFLVLGDKVSANVYESNAAVETTAVIVEKNITELFSERQATDKVLPLPEGGFLYGEGKLVDKDDFSKVLSEYNSETDEKSITVAQAKSALIKQMTEEIEAQKSFLNRDLLAERGTAPPTINYFLIKGETYKSEAFSGSGWRYAGYWFINEYVSPDTGYHSFSGPLDFQTVGDSARVGDREDVDNLYYHQILGGYQINPADGFVRIKSGLSGQPQLTYFTNNPINGSYYIVRGTGVA